MTNQAIRLVLLISVLNIAPLVFGADRLSVADRGVSTKVVLDRLDEKAAHILRNAAAARSLSSSKSVRSIELEIVALHQQLAANQLRDDWDRLNRDEIVTLQMVDSQLEALSKNTDVGGKIGDEPVLDIDQVLSRITLLKDVPTLRRVWGASQYYKSEGFYTISLHGNIFTQSAGKPEVWIGERRVDQEIGLSPPYDAIVKVPVQLLNADFGDRDLKYIPVVIKQRVPDRTYVAAAVRQKFVIGEFKFILELFPKYSAEYRLTEYDDEMRVDPSRVEVQPGKEMVIPGCGNSGCNAYYTVCTDVPPGAQPLSAVDFYDSFSGWGAFESSSITSTGICARYHQHSHNVTRLVRFNVQYHPTSQGIAPHNLNLAPKLLDQITNHSTPEEAQDQEEARALVSDGHDNGSAPLPNPGVSKPGVVKLDKDYEAHFSNNMRSFVLVFRLFTGEELTVTQEHGSDRLRTLKVDDHFWTVAIKRPW